jgi:hypothetical protein
MAQDLKRLELQQILETIMGNENVYFQPPTNLQMSYPCIVYNRDYATTEYAENVPYQHTKRYQLTVIDQDPDSPIPAKIAALPMSAFNRFFTADNLNHDVFNLFY